MKYQSEQAFLIDAIAFQDGSLDPARIPGFEEAITTSKEFRKAFIRQQLTCAQYIEIQRRQALTSSLSRSDTTPHRSKNEAWRKYLWPVFAVAACLTLFMILGTWESDLPIEGVKITRDRSATWSGQTPSDGHLLFNGEVYRLQSGALRMQMPAGGIVSVAAPAVFSAISADTIELVEGKIAARLPNEESQLKIITNGMTVTDLGTAFGVSASTGGESSIAVFEGKVRLESAEMSQNSSMTLTAGASVLADIFAPVPIDQEIFDSNRYQDIWPLTVGIDEASSLIEFVPPGPISNLDGLHSDEKLFILPEQLDIKLLHAIDLDQVPDKGWSTGVGRNGRLPAGQIVRSYLLFFSPETVSQNRFHRIQGSVTFSRPVLGVIVESEKLESTDAILGLDSLNYESRKARGLEDSQSHRNQLPADSLHFKDDGRVLYFDLNVGTAVDNFRVLVSAD